MSMPAQRFRWLMAALLLTLLAAWLAPPVEDESLVSAPQRVRSADDARWNASAAESRKQANDTALDVLGIKKRVPLADEALAAGVFATAIQVPVAKPAEVSKAEEIPLPPPQAPPLPFRFLGRYEDAGQSVVFLQYNDQSLVVRLGDTLGEQYKVEQITATSLELRYLPLNQIQNLDMGAGR